MADMERRPASGTNGRFACSKPSWRPGAEPPILAIHGSTMSAYTFTALAERLTPDVRFVAVDLRGHGFSDKPPAGYDVEADGDAAPTGSQLIAG